MTIPILFSNRLRPTMVWSFRTSLPVGLTFTSASSNRSYFGADGVMQFAGINQPRFDFDPVTHKTLGLLMEEQRTNLVPVSVINEAFSGTTPQGMAIHWEYRLTAPDGTDSFTALSDSADTGIHYLGLGNASFVAGKTYTASVYAKKNTASILQLTFPQALFSALVYANFDLNTGTIVQVGSGCTASIKHIGGGVYRCSITAMCSVSGSTFSLILGFTNGVAVSGRLPTYTGTDKVINVWGAQTEVGPFASTYIPTVGTIVTRAADVLYTTSIPWFNPTQGTILGIGIPMYSVPANRSYLTGFSDGTGNNVIANLIETTGRPIGGNVISGTVSISGSTLPIVTANSDIKSAVVYKAGSNLIVSSSSADTAGAFGPSGVPTGISRLDIGCGTIADRQFNGTIKQISYYNKALPTSELQRITA